MIGFKLSQFQIILSQTGNTLVFFEQISLYSAYLVCKLSVLSVKNLVLRAVKLHKPLVVLAFKLSYIY